MRHIFAIYEYKLHRQCFKTQKQTLRITLEYMKLHSLFLYYLEMRQEKSERKKKFLK